MTTFVFALMFLLQATPTQIPVNRSLEKFNPEPFLDKGQIPPVLMNSVEETIIASNFQVMAHLCKQSPDGEALSALARAAEYGKPEFVRVVALYALAIAAKQGCQYPGSGSERAVLLGLQSEPPEDVCTPTVIGDFALGHVSEIPCTAFDSGLNVVEAAAWAAVYFGPPGPYEAPAKEFKSALEQIAADPDQKRHGQTIAAAKEALRRLEKK